MSEDICYLTGVELLDAYRAKRLSPVEVTKAVLARIDGLNPQLNAFCHRDDAAALKAAAESEARWQRGEPAGLLDGVPTSIKDLLLTKGWPTMRGSKTVDRWQKWEEDAPCVARLREQNAILIGKTTTPELGWKGVTDNPLTGVTRNPWNVALTPGGSSGGASAAVAAGLGPLAIGTDGGGSIRMPCGFTGLAGLKPTFGRVPAYPASYFGTLAHVGPMTRTVADSALLMSAIARPDARDPLQLPPDVRDFGEGLDDGIAGLRVAYSPDLGFARVDAEVAALCAAAARVFAEELGARLEEAAPGFDNPQETFRTLWYGSAAAMFRSITAQKRRQADPGLLAIVEEGERLSAADFVIAERERASLGILMARFHERFDILVTPQLPITAFTAGQEVPDGWWSDRWFTWSPFTYPFNLTRQPAASVPCGFTGAGLPVNLQIVGPLGADALVLRAARAFERARPQHHRRPPLQMPPPKAPAQPVTKETVAPASAS